MFRSDRFGTFRGREHSEDLSRINRIGAVVVSLCRQSSRLNGAVDCRFRDASVAGGFSQAQHGVPLWRYPVTIAVNRNPFLRNPQFTTASKAARLFGQCGGCALGSVAREGSGCVMRPALRYWPVGRSAGLDCMAAFDPLRTLAGCAKVLPCSRIGLKSARRMRLLGRHCPRAALCSAGWRRRKTSI